MKGTTSGMIPLAGVLRGVDITESEVAENLTEFVVEGPSGQQVRFVWDADADEWFLELAP